MNSNISLGPYHAPADFRAYVYDAVVLAWEINSVNINASTFSKKALDSHCGLYVLKLGKLSDVQLRYQDAWLNGEFLVFYNEGKGYECLFKRLRDTFAHGHYCQSKRGWITVMHRYKTHRENVEKTRIFGNLKITTLKNLVAYLVDSTVKK